MTASPLLAALATIVALVVVMLALQDSNSTPLLPMIRGEVLCSSLRDGRTVRFSRDFGGRPNSYRWLGTDMARDAGRRVWQTA